MFEEMISGKNGVFSSLAGPNSSSLIIILADNGELEALLLAMLAVLLALLLVTRLDALLKDTRDDVFRLGIGTLAKLLADSMGSGLVRGSDE